MRYTEMKKYLAELPITEKHPIECWNCCGSNVQVINNTHVLPLEDREYQQCRELKVDTGNVI
jgi:hypothetical protein